VVPPGPPLGVLIEPSATPRLVSTGRLPTGEQVQRLVDRTHEELRGVDDGEVSAVYPALGAVPPGLFGICVVSLEGNEYAAGDVDVPFALMSVAKPFVLALAVEELGAEAVVQQVGVDATGLPFDSVAAVEQSADGRTNPMVNAGALATTALLPGAGLDERWQHLVDGLSRFAGRRLELDEGVYASASATNLRNRAIAAVLQAHGRLATDPAEALDLYTRQSSLRVTARDLAVMGATLADGGVNPETGERVVDAESARFVLAVMATAGMYTGSGQWLCEVGLPAKSGIGGGIVTVAPGKGGLGTYSPPLDRHGNSVRGSLAARRLSYELGLDLFASAPARPGG
jgi:glutaminase